MIRKLIVMLTFIWLILSCYYFAHELDWKSGSVLAAGVIAFFTALANCKATEKLKEKINQKAKAKNKSTIIQVGGSYNHNDAKGSENE